MFLLVTFADKWTGSGTVTTSVATAASWNIAAVHTRRLESVKQSGHCSPVIEISNGLKPDLVP
jgi:hypothetical protein